MWWNGASLMPNPILFLVISSMTQCCSCLQKTLTHAGFAQAIYFLQVGHWKMYSCPSYTNISSAEVVVVHSFYFLWCTFLWCHFPSFFLSFCLFFYLFCLVPCPALTFLFPCAKWEPGIRESNMGTTGTLNNKWSSSKFLGVAFKIMWWKIEIFHMLSLKTLVLLLAWELTLREMPLKWKQAKHKQPKAEEALHTWFVHHLWHLLVMTDGHWQPSSGWDGTLGPLSPSSPPSN